jgi:hypothetical protein
MNAFLHFIINNEIIHCFWDSVGTYILYYLRNYTVYITVAWGRKNIIGVAQLVLEKKNPNKVTFLGHVTDKEPQTLI